MSKWRPAEKDCLYIIGDIHGLYNQIKIIFARIFPLRKSDGINDRVIFLGDYVDRNIDSHKVLDLLIEKKNKFKDKILFLKGNHEKMFLEAIKNGNSNPSNYDLWLINGGEKTLMGYLQRNNLPLENAWNLSRGRLKDLVPEEHIYFLENYLLDYIETKDYVFVHGGCDPLEELKYQDESILLWDRSLHSFVKRMFIHKNKLPWNKTIVTGHNTYEKSPFIYDKYIMLDCSSQSSVCVLELNSMEGFISKSKNGKLVKLDPSFFNLD